MFMIKQLGYNPDIKGTVAPCDFCVTKKNAAGDEWLTNKRHNGYSYKSTGYYTTFTLVVRR